MDSLQNLPVNLVDIGVVIVMVVSALLAYSRGLVRETLSIASWIAAAVATVYGFQPLRPLLQRYVTLTILADAITAAGIFIVTLVVCAAIAHVMVRGVRRSGALGAVDRSLGLLFGILRGAVLICLAYLLFLWVVQEQDRPPLVKEARTLPLIAAGADILRLLLPEDLLRQGEEAAGAARSKFDKAVGAGTTLDALPGQPPAAPGAGQDSAAPPAGSGYKENERQEIDQLIQGTQ